VQLLPIEVNSVQATSFHNRDEMIAYHLFFSFMVGDPTMVVLQLMNVILAPPGIHSHVEKIGVCASLLYIGNTGALVFTSSFNHGKSDHLTLKPIPKMQLINAKRPMLLSHVEM
jgi:hypothetical protein